MPISILCPGCGQRLKGPDALAGRRVPCPKCRQEIHVPPRNIADEDEAASLLLKDQAEEPTESKPAPEPPRRKQPREGISAPPSRHTEKTPTPVAESMRPLTSQEPPPWLRHFHWMLVLALVPLTLSLLNSDPHDDDLEHLLDETYDNAPPDVQKKLDRLVEQTKGNPTLDEILRVLPDEKLSGAALPRKSLMHWGFAVADAALFLGFCVLLASGGVAQPSHLLSVGLFTGTIGILLLLGVQALADATQGVWPRGGGILMIFIYIAKLIGLSYSAAMDPSVGFVPSFLGFTAGVGLCEELCKALPVLWYCGRGSQVGWRTAFLWGLASGAGFGIAEGIMYSANYYNGIAGPDIYVVRFLSCVALHALWTGSVAIAIQQKRHFLDNAQRWHDWIAPVLVYLAIPAVLHGLYDTFLKKDMNAGALLVALLSFGYLAFQISRLHGADDVAANAALLKEYQRRREVHL